MVCSSQGAGDLGWRDLNMRRCLRPRVPQWYVLSKGKGGGREKEVPSCLASVSDCSDSVNMEMEK